MPEGPQSRRGLPCLIGACGSARAGGARGDASPTKWPVMLSSSRAALGSPWPASSDPAIFRSFSPWYVLHQEKFFLGVVLAFLRKNIQYISYSRQQLEIPTANLQNLMFLHAWGPCVRVCAAANACRAPAGVTSTAPLHVSLLVW